MTTQTIDLAERYVAMWNEKDPAAGRGAIRELWTEDAAHILQPPQEMRDTAATIGFFAPTLEARGRAALEARVKRAHDEFVASGEYLFRPRGDTVQLGDVVKFGWDMIAVAGGQPAGAGVEFVILDVYGQIRADYQFIER
jgi:ribosomal protein L27